MSEVSRACTLGRWTTDRAAADPRRPAIVDRGIALDYGELDGRAEALAFALSEAGHGRGSRIATVTGSTSDHIVLFLACAKAGCALVPLSWRLTPGELAAQLRVARPSLLLLEDDHRALAEEAVAQSGLDIPMDCLGGEGVERAVPPARRPLPAGVPTDDDPLLLIFTSGTTGSPKAVVLTHASCHWTNLALSRAQPMMPQSVVLQTLPQHHVAGWNVQPLLALWVGATLVLERTFDAGRALALVESHRVTHTMGVPTTYRAMVEHPDFGSRDLSSLQQLVVGGAMLLPSTREAFAARGLTLAQGYGLSEAGPNVTLATCPEDIGTVGRPYPHVDVALLVDGDVVRGPGAGELLVAGPSTFQGYLDDPVATAAARHGDWLRTGDLARVDARGRVTIVDRIKDLVRSGSETVAPAEVEAALLTHPGVLDAAVAGVPHDYWGEEVVAWVVTGGQTVTPEELSEHLDTRLARFKHPKRYVQTTQIPRTVSGKPLRRTLAETEVTR